MLEIELTDDGFLVNHEQWSEEFAVARAEQLGICYDDQQIKIVAAVRLFYAQSNISPANRALLKLARVALNQDTMSSIDLIDLFLDKPALNCARIAGLPRPKNCF